MDSYESDNADEEPVGSEYMAQIKLCRDTNASVNLAINSLEISRTQLALMSMNA